MSALPAGARDDALVVLAGGLSRRLGRDKALEPFGDPPQPLALRALDRLAPLASRRVLVRAAAFPRLPAGVIQVADDAPGAGPLQALACAFAAVPARRHLVAPCDLPWLEPGVHRALLAALGDAEVAVARAPDGLEPLVSVWTAAAAATVVADRELLDGISVHALLVRLRTAEVEFGDPRPFVNVNSAAELRSAAVAAAGCAT